MSTDPFSKLSRCIYLVVALLLTTPISVQAAPLGTIRMEGRKVGSSEWLGMFYAVAPGDVIEYRLLADMAPIGTTNGTHTITGLTRGTDGFQSLSMKITQSASERSQIDFRPPLSDPNALASFRNGWADGIGASVGTLSPRPGGTGNDITDIRPVHAAGTYSAIDPEVILTDSTFIVISTPAPKSVITIAPSWGTGSGALRINGSQLVFISLMAQNGSDPPIAFVPLLLNVPEPGTFVLAGMGLCAIILFARRCRAK